MDTDSALIARVLRHDDRAAFAELVRRHQGMVRGFLRRMLAGGAGLGCDLADDLAQETFIKAYHALAQYRADASFGAWLCAISANELRAEGRRRQRRQILQARNLDELEGTCAEAAPEGAGDLPWALGLLPEMQRAALVLCFEQGLTHEEAAVALQCPVGTLKSHIARGKARLRQLLTPERSHG
jgi:RNA polymerase sigma factor (sigma-70 family)